jgi:hypothetical protein
MGQEDTENDDASRSGDAGHSPGGGDGSDAEDEPDQGGSSNPGDTPKAGEGQGAGQGAGDGQGSADEPDQGGTPGSGNGAEGFVALTGAAALKEYLDGQEENTPANPYRIRLAGINLASKVAGNTLKGFYAALSRYAALDLRDSYGETYININIETEPNKEKITEIILPPGLNSIEKNAFAKCAELVLADLSGATIVKHGAFSRCVKLETLVMKEVREIEYTSEYAEGAFYNCDSLVSVSLPRAVKIGKKSFFSCDSLATVYAPLVTAIDDSAFAQCKQLAQLILGETPPDLGAGVFVEGKPEVIYVPSSSISTYKTTVAKGWTEELKARVQALP